MDKKNIKSKNWIDLGVTSSETEPESIKKLMFQLLPATLLKDVKNDQDLNKQFDEIFEKMFYTKKAGRSLLSKESFAKELLFKFTEFNPLEVSNPNERDKVYAFIKYLNDIKPKIDVKKALKSFPQYLNIPERKRDAFAEELRNTFNTGKGKELRYMIEALINCQILPITDNPEEKRKINCLNEPKKHIVDSMKEYFIRDIGSNQAILEDNIYYDRGYKKRYDSKILGAQEKIKIILKKLCIENK